MGAPRIHGELFKLGFAVAQSTVAKYMAGRADPSGQRWSTFLRNHSPHIAAMDLFVVPTIGFNLLYVLVIVRLARRELVWLNVTAHPTRDSQQITEAFPWTDAPRYLIRDRDAIYGATVTRRLRAMGIRDKPIAPGSPWQNSFAERLIGSIRRECVDHVIALGEQHLRRVLKSYAIYYNSARTHRSLDKDSPVSRPVQRVGRIVLHDWSAGFITSTSESNFSVRTRAPRARSCRRRTSSCSGRRAPERCDRIPLCGESTGSVAGAGVSIKVRSGRSGFSNDCVTPSRVLLKERWTLHVFAGINSANAPSFTAYPLNCRAACGQRAAAGGT